VAGKINLDGPLVLPVEGFPAFICVETTEVLGGALAQLQKVTLNKVPLSGEKYEPVRGQTGEIKPSSRCEGKFSFPDDILGSAVDDVSFPYLYEVQEISGSGETGDVRIYLQMQFQQVTQGEEVLLGGGFVAVHDSNSDPSQQILPTPIGGGGRVRHLLLRGGANNNNNNN